MEFEQKISEEIFRRKYMINGEKDVDQVFMDVAEEISEAEAADKKQIIKQKFFEEMSSGRFIPGGRILANARIYSKMKNYNNCFTIDIEDSMEGIYGSLREDAVISSMGGGVGFDISKLRPEGAIISKGGESSGPLSFLKVFDQSAKVIHTGGGRRSAHIALMDVSHPDIEKFITIKQGDKNKELTQFNISVRITDAFIEAVQNNEDWNLVYEGEIFKTVKAKDLYDLMVKNAFQHNEPGIFNIDTVERFNNGWWAFKQDRVNPCGEICMPSYSLCCLGSNNLIAFVRNAFTAEAYFDFEQYKKSIRLGVRFLDNVLDRTHYPLKKIEDFSKQWRRIGLGFTGLGDALAMLGITYGSDKSLEICEEIANTLRDESYIASVELAKEKGSFPAIDIEKLLQGNFINQLPNEIRNQIKKHGMRNIALNTCAPNGTISLSVGQNCSSGIEPIFSLSYDRNIRTGTGEETKKETVYDYAWLKYIEYYNHQHSAEIAQDLLQGIDKPIPKPDYFVTSLDVDPYRGVDVQAVFQKYIDHSISKTANLPMGFTYDQYKDLFMYAYKKGLKGFTSFNPEGSIKPILEHKKEEQKKEDGYETVSEKFDIIQRSNAPKRPIDLPCEIHKVSIKDEKFLILVGEYNGTLYEMFATNITEENNIDTDNYKKGIIRKNGKGDYSLLVQNGVQKTMIKNIGKTFNKDYETMTRLISANLRHGIPLEFTVEQLNKDTNFVGFAKSVARVLKKYIKDGEKVKTNMTCPECGSSDSFIYKEGCISCANCGWSKCS